jgi:hypothetical protein
MHIVGVKRVGLSVEHPVNDSALVLRPSADKFVSSFERDVHITFISLVRSGDHYAQTRPSDSRRRVMLVWCE